MSRRERARLPARRTPFREPRRQILVVAEGVVTEREYIEGFAQNCRHPLVRVVVAQQHGDPSHVVKVAKQKRDLAEAEARGARDDNLRYDEVWCVFDRDEHVRFNEAIDHAQACGLMVAVSNPCFELWLLLHLRDNPGMRDHRAMQRLLAAELPSYDKHLELARLLPTYSSAVQRAQRLDERADQDGEPYRNPSTGVYRLTESIRIG